MLYATGDTHGVWIRLNTDNFLEQKDMTRNDYVLILGDFGLFDDNRQERYWLDWLDAKPWTTIWTEGNHDNMDRLDAFPVTEDWHGGKVHKIRDNVIHLIRGNIYDLDGRKVYVFGGARSHDISDGILDPSDPDYRKKKRDMEDRGAWYYRTHHKDWWAREMPSEAEMAEGSANLERYYWNVDYILSHCPPTRILQEMDAGRGIYQPDYLTDYLQQISDRCRYNTWLFGHMHQNKKIDDKHFCLYEQIVKVW